MNGFSVYFEQQHNVQLLIVARDGGSPPLSAEVTMDIEITQITNEYPQWVSDYTSAPPIRIPESVPVNFEVGRFRATSTVPDASLNYFIARGDTPQQNGEPISFYSRLDERTNEMVLLTYRILDYETLSRYTLTIKAAVSVTVIVYIFLHQVIGSIKKGIHTYKICSKQKQKQLLFCHSRSLTV